MRIALDATYSVGRNLSGVGVYSQEILGHLPVLHPGARYLFCYRPHRFLRGLKTALPPNTGRTLLWKDWPYGVDLFHGLNQRVDSKRFRRVVTTFHDLFVLTGSYSTPEFRARFSEQARTAAERSDLIIAVSEFTATQVESLLKVPRSRIRVIHHGVQPAVVSNRRPLREILFVGALQTRKNIVNLVKAFEQTSRGWRLVLAGSSGYGADEILEAIRSSPRAADIDLPGYVSQEALQELYRRASIFAFPSLDEGFGMPVLEAMAHGVPVLTSNSSALLEISGNAALLIDPKDPAAIAAGLNALILDETLRKELTVKGLAHSALFTWKGAVEKTWAAYQELLP